MTAIDDIIKAVPMDQLASLLGVDKDQAEQATALTIPKLFEGLVTNALNPQGEASLAGALEQHAQSSLLNGGIDLAQVDTTDGEKIVNHILGPQQDTQIQSLGMMTGLGAAAVKKLLPILAPIVLSYLATTVAGGKYGDILGPILQGMTGQAQQQQANTGGGILADVLGQVLRGGSGQQGDLGGILGSILGG